MSEYKFSVSVKNVERLAIFEHCNNRTYWFSDALSPRVVTFLTPVRTWRIWRHIWSIWYNFQMHINQYIAHSHCECHSIVKQSLLHLSTVIRNVKQEDACIVEEILHRITHQT